MNVLVCGKTDMNMSISTRNRLLTFAPVMGYFIPRNTPVSFGEGARSRSERIGSCFFWRVSA